MILCRAALCLTLTLVLWTVPILGSCVHDAEGSLGLIGGWEYRDLSEADEEFTDKITKLVDRAVKVYNSEANSRIYEADKTSQGKTVISAVYTQLVNGINYCIRYPVHKVVCGNNIDKSDCQSVCEVNLYTPFDWNSDSDSQPVMNSPPTCKTLTRSKTQRHRQQLATMQKWMAGHK